MHSRCNGPILLGAVAICIALAVMEPDINVNKSLGFKMCDSLCNRTAGCDLYCHLTHEALPKHINIEKKIWHSNPTKNKEIMHGENAVNCNQDENIYYTRGRIVQCRPILSRHPNLSSKTKGKMTRILLLARTNHLQQGRQLYLDNNHVIDYPCCHTKHIQAVAYISSQSKLIVSTFSPIRLFFTPIDEEKKTFIKTKCDVRAIAIDDHKQLVFIKVVKPERSVCVMSTDGKNITPLFSFSSSCGMRGLGGFVADHKRSLIYAVCSRNKLLQITYQGVSKGNVVGSGSGYGYGLHMQGDVLYYQTRKGEYLYIHELYLSDHSVTETAFHISKIPSIDAMLTIGNILYIITYSPRGPLFAVNMSDMVTVTKLNIGFKWRGGVIMCFIP